MNYWLMKSEPDVFSIHHLKQKKVAGWDGVRNYQARNFLRAMRKGDRALFYHSSTTPPAIVGEMAIVREAYPDPNQFEPKNPLYDPASPPDNPRWYQVDVRFLRIFNRPLPLPEIRATHALRSMLLVRRGRLSVLPVSPAEWKVILQLTGQATA